MNALLSGVHTLAILLFIGCSGCATVDHHQAKTASHAFTETHATPLGEEAAQLLTTRNPGHSGFIPLIDGVEALAYRLALIESAKVSIDVQYYLIKNDVIGRIFVAALYKAAERGVRVRVNLDDIFTKGYDEALLALNAHRNIEIRLFNPWSARKVRTANVLSFSMLNRRLHNKSLIADNQFTVIGGRNIAGEYFAARPDLNFMDADVVAVGPIVHEVSTMFDAYWNSHMSVPMEQLAKPKLEQQVVIDALFAAAEQDVKSFENTSYERAVKDDVERMVNDLEAQFSWAAYKFIYDSPDKAYSNNPQSSSQTIVAPIRDLLNQAREEIVIISPYFVPLKNGVAKIAELVDKGVATTIITNSLASNNHTLVHAGYSHYRKDIIKAGAQLYETKYRVPAAVSERIDLGEAGATLHTKAFFVDRKLAFVGSFNFDPRSANINTEMGVVIYSEDLAQKSLEGMQQRLNEFTYNVVLNEENKVRWVDHSGTEPKVHNKEPDTGFWRRTYSRFLSILPIRSQL